MSLFNRLFSGRGLTRLLLIAAFGLLAAACWFLGPWFGFGNARPLETSAARVVVLVALLGIFLLCWNRLPWFLSLTVGVLALVWVVSPFLLIGEQHPFEQVSHRVVLMAVILLIAVLYGLWRLMRALAQDPTLLTRWAKKSAEQPASMRIDNAAINAVIEGGVRYMRRIHRTIPAWRRFFSTGHRRSWLPWFLVMGTASSGKTAMLFSSGQEFPLPEQLNRMDKENPPTDPCECLFTNDALFLDTAGKYAGDDEHAQQEWKSLVAALKKHRPVRGINGVILALSTEDILHKSQADRLTLAATLRARLDELRAQLGVRFPVYVTVTKLDLLTGFEEYFRNLTTQEREQVWGITLPWDNEPSTSTTTSLKGWLQEELGLLQNRLSRVMYLRLQEEYDVGDRKRMYALPQDFGLLAQGVSEVVQNIFFASRYDETQFHPTLRGVYFVSNCQPRNWSLRNNSTLLQKWQNLLQQKSPGTPASLSSQNEEEGLISEGAWGKHYFLTQLFSDVITRDRDLVSYNLRLQSQYRVKNVFGHLLSWGVACWLCLALVTSYQLNRGYLDALSFKLDGLSKDVGHYISKPAPALLPGVLNGTQQLAQYDDLDVWQPDREWRFGLYTGRTVAKGADALYHFFLQRYLLPQVETQALQDVEKALQSSDDEALWAALKRYLMIGGLGKLDSRWLVPQIAASWERSGAIQPYRTRENFIEHLSVLFSQPQWRQYGQAPDTEVIKQARARLAEQPESARVWQRLKQQLEEDAPPSLSLRGMVGADAPAVFTLDDEKLLQQGIPGIYTRQGWENQVKKKILSALLTLQGEDSWVMGQSAVATNPVEFREAVLAQYLREYRDHWQRFLNSLRLIPMGVEQQATAQSSALDIALLRAMVADNSPLRMLLNRAVEETTLADNKKTLTDELTRGAMVNQGRVLQQAKKLQEAVDFREQQLIRHTVDDRFAALRQFVRGDRPPGAPADFVQMQGTSLSRVLGMLSDQYTRLVVYNSALGQGDIPPLTDDGARLAAEAETWPEPVHNLIAPLLVRSYDKMQQRVVSTRIASIAEGPGEICRTTLQGRYPFADSSREVSLADFERFFAPGGIVDAWFQQNLAARVDSTVSPWRFKGTEDTRGLAFFEQVAHIRHLFFPQGGQKMALSLSAAVDSLSPEITQFILNVDGNKLRYAHGPVVEQQLDWPGERRGTMLSMIARSRQTAALPDKAWRGPWALLHWLDNADAIRVARDNQLLVRWSLDPEESVPDSGATRFLFSPASAEKQVTLRLSGADIDGKMLSEWLRDFRCPALSE